MLFKESQYEKVEEPRVLIFSCNYMLSRDTQFWNVALPIDSNADENLTDLSDSACLNAMLPREVTVSGIEILSSEVQ